MQSAVKSFYNGNIAKSTPKNFNNDYQYNTGEKDNESNIYDVGFFRKKEKNNETVIFSKGTEYVLIENGNDDSTNYCNPLIKVGALSMSINIPQPMRMYLMEMHDSYKEGIITKLSFTFGLGLIFNWMGISPAKFGGGLAFFLVIALLDLGLAYIPGVIKPGTEKEHTAQAKLWSFVTNLITIVAGFLIHGFFQTLISNPNFIEKYTVVNIHFWIIGWVGMIYAYRIVAYSARANNTKVPTFITKYFDKNE